MATIPGSIHQYLWDVHSRSEALSVFKQYLRDMGYDNLGEYVSRHYPDVWFRYKAWRAVNGYA